MIGNDIVDLAEAKLKSNWQRPRFLEKLFTKQEQLLIQNSDTKFLMVWRLWSMKEAAYKLYTQLQPSRFYNPKQFQCEINGLKGNVKFQDFKCFVQTIINSNYILSEARLKEIKMRSEIVLFNTLDTENQSSILKLRLIDTISKTQNVAASQLRFIKSEFGIPTVNYNSEAINVSLTHHGNYGAFAIM